MAELLNSKMEKRVIFPVGEQYHFLSKTVGKLKLSWAELTDIIGVHKRTFNDWKREKYSMPLRVVQDLSQKAKIQIPPNIELRDRYWYTALGSSAGAKAVLKKYGRIGGDLEYWKKKWYEWWEREGKYRKNLIVGVTKPIKKPRFSEELAEFVGIMIGDGGIAKKQVIVSLNRGTEKLYSIFVRSLIKKLFKVEPSIYNKHKSTVDVVVSRTKLVMFCKSIGLKIGNKLKQNLDIPEWIKRNKSFKISCIKGLIDTDGCLFREYHRINGRTYCYPRLCFTSYSTSLCSSVVRILKELDFSPKIRNKRNVQLENQSEIMKYFDLIGTHNPNIQKRYKLMLGGVGSGCPK
ncbi:MAG: hypothetical protein ACKKMS_01040 [Candidatus Nealsonbacteria bacterium]